MKKLVAGVGIGGIYTNCALIDENGKFYAWDKFSTSDYEDFTEFIEKIRDVIVSLYDSLEGDHLLEFVGVAAPKGNYYTGTIEDAANLLWKGTLPLAEMLSESLGGIKVIVTNDANAEAIGEMNYGGAKGMKNFIEVTMNQGIGSGIVIDGNVVYGNDGFAGEFGHITYKRENGRVCGCGRKGCLECYTSAKGVVATARELLGESSTDSVLRKLSPDEITIEDVVKAAQSHDAIAIQSFTLAGKALGESLANLASITSPQAIFLSGTVAMAGKYILNPTILAFEENIMHIWRGKIQIKISSLESDKASIYGAASLAIKELKKKYAFFERRKVI